MPRNKRESDFPVSRDYADIDCLAVGCLYNLNKKCMVSSLAKIGKEGNCMSFKTRTFEKQVDGD